MFNKARRWGRLVGRSKRFKRRIRMFDSLKAKKRQQKSERDRRVNWGRVRVMGVEGVKEIVESV